MKTKRIMLAGLVGLSGAAHAAFITIGDGNKNYWNDGGRTVGLTAPASFVTLHEAMKCCNWRTSGKP